MQNLKKYLFGILGAILLLPISAFAYDDHERPRIDWSVCGNSQCKRNYKSILSGSKALLLQFSAENQSNENGDLNILIAHEFIDIVNAVAKVDDPSTAKNYIDIAIQGINKSTKDRASSYDAAMFQVLDVAAKIKLREGDKIAAYNYFRRAYSHAFNSEPSLITLELIELVDDLERLNIEIEREQLVALEKATPGAIANYNSGLESFAKNDFRDAKYRFGLAINGAPEFALFYLARSRSEFELNEANPCLDDARKAMQYNKHPNSNAFDFEMGFAHALAGNAKMAKQSFLDGIRAAPWVKTTRSAYEKYLEINEQIDHPRAWEFFKSARAKFEAGKNSESFNLLNAAIELSPDFGQYYFWRSLNASTMERNSIPIPSNYAGIFKDISKAQGLDPENTDFLSSGASFLTNTGNIDDGYRWAKYALWQDRDDKLALSIALKKEAAAKSDHDAWYAQQMEKYDQDTQNKIDEKKRRNDADFCKHFSSACEN